MGFPGSVPVAVPILVLASGGLQTLEPGLGLGLKGPRHVLGVLTLGRMVYSWRRCRTQRSLRAVEAICQQEGKHDYWVEGDPRTLVDANLNCANFCGALRWIIGFLREAG